MERSFSRRLSGADPRLIRQINRNALFEAIRSHTPITISELSSQTGLSFSTVNSVLKDLVDLNLILVTGTTESTGGRKPVLYSLNVKDIYVCGVDVDAHTLRVALLKLDGSIVATSVVQVENAQPLELGSLLVSILDQLLSKVGTHLDRIIGVGVSQRGMVDPEGRKVRLDVQHGWQEVPLGSVLQQELPMPVFLVEDTRAKLTAEMEFGSAKSRQNVLYLLIGSPHGEGVSGGFVSDKSILAGAQGFAGEVGHTLVDPAGPLCSCGRRGCWEAVGDVSHLIARVAALKPDSAEPAGLAEPPDRGPEAAAKPAIGPREALLRIRTAVVQGDPAVTREFDWFVGIQAEGIANLIHTFNPQHIILAGEVIALGDVFLASLRSAIERRVMKPFLEGLEFEFSSIDENSALLGASAIVLRQAIAIMERSKK